MGFRSPVPNLPLSVGDVAAGAETPTGKLDPKQIFRHSYLDALLAFDTTFAGKGAALGAVTPLQKAGVMKESFSVATGKLKIVSG